MTISGAGSQWDSDSVYVGDSFGGHSYIARKAGRACTSKCGCHRLDPLSQNPNFSFTVRKSTTSIEVGLLSPFLRRHVFRLLESHSHMIPGRAIDGFVLLENIDLLRTNLGAIRRWRRLVTSSKLLNVKKRRAQLEAEMTLLVEGLLLDHQVWESFGFEELYQNGHLTYRFWKALQKCKTMQTIDSLEKTFDQYNEDCGSEGVCERCGKFQDPSSHGVSESPSVTQCQSCSKHWRLQYLHQKFREVHSRAKSSLHKALFSPAVRGPGPRLVTLSRHGNDLLFNDPSKSWRNGMSVLRQLCIGRLPQNVSYTIDFLLVAEAIALSMSMPEARTRFDRDLCRWSILFDDDYPKAQALRNAFETIWGFENHFDDGQTTPDGRSLLYFEELASNLAMFAASCVDPKDTRVRDGYSLLASQAMVREAMEADCGKSHGSLDGSAQICRSQLDEAPGDTDMGEQESTHEQSKNAHPITIDRRNTIMDHESIEPKAILLLAGFIFCVVLLFLIGMESD